MIAERTALTTTPDGFEAVFTVYAPFVTRALRRLGVRDADVEDVSQDVFVTVHRRLASFDRECAFSTWLFAICARTAANYRRKAHRSRERPSDVPPESSAPDDQHDELVRRRDLAMLHAILERLDDDKRAIFVLHELEQVPVAEAAKAFGLPLQTAYSRLYAARKHVASAVRRAEIADERLADQRRGVHAGPLLAMFPWIHGGPALPPSFQLGAGKLGSIARGGWVAKFAAVTTAGGLAVAGVGALFLHGAFVAPFGGVSRVSASVSDASNASNGSNVSNGSRAVAAFTAPVGPHTGASAPDLGGRGAELVGLASLAASAGSAASLLPVAGPAATLPTPPTSFALPPGPSSAAVRSSPPATASGRTRPALHDGASDQEAEVALLRRARATLAKDPAAALDLGNEHAKRFRDGRLEEEREVIAISALVDLGRGADAKARAASFVARFPSSAHRRRVEALVASVGD